MRSITIGELKKIFEQYDDDTEVYYGDETISVVSAKDVLNVDTMKNETQLILE